MIKIVFRPATSSDSPRIASLHAESWRTTYRSILPDAYLGQEIFKERKRFWRGRFLAPGMDRRYVLLAELAKGLVGFVCVLLDEEPEWGACLDNLHARSKFEGQGLGRQLFTKATEWVMEKESVWPIHLWVFKSNHAGRRFYDALNGHIVERKDKQMPGGANVPSRRYLWRNIQQLLSDLTAPILPRS